MTRPHIIRADTIDLQDQDAPSAKDHSRQPTHPAPLGAGPPAPHQAGAIRQADEIAAEEEHYQSPPVSNLQDNINQPSFEEGSDAYDLEHGSNGILNDQLNEQAVGQNGGHSGIGTEDADMADAEGDDGLDDDMMDKISSSPSIDDGGYHLSSFWPKRADSLNSTPAQSNNPPHSFLTINVGSSSPFVSTPSPFPLVPHKEQGMDPSEVHHLQGEYEIRGDYDQDEGFEDFEDEERDRLSPLISEQCFGYFREELNDLQDSYERDFDGHDIRTLLLPSDDPLLDNSFDDAPLSPSPTKSFSSASSSSWESDDELNDDDTKDFLFSDDPRYTDSGWGGECLREIEDIDFEFVYALHTFVATVEGQANATKGDTMVLLDDSNSYWWLVRVVKDSSIGYLPAEHIETPTERLARLNKHRNIDLSATMLGDNPEKSKNPLKKAMRRRNAKTVTFSAPTYVEASDFDYSSDEEAGDGENNGNEVNVVEAHSLQQEDQDEITAVEPLKVRSQGQDGRIEPLAAEAVPKEDGKLDGKAPTDTLRTSDEMFDRQVDGVFAKSRNGIVRDTDSFFKDDNVETRKITLTPNLLRDDSSSSTVRSVDSKELKSRGSSEAIEKAITSPERAKDDRRKKEKKSGMLSGLFKRKDKKSKGQDDEAEETEKISGELLRESPQPKGSGDVSPADSMNAVQAQQQPPRQTAKLQKQPPLAKLSPVREPSATQAPQTREPVGRPVPAPERPAPTAIEDRPAIRFVSPDVDRSHEDGILASRVRSPDQQPRDQIISLEAPMDTNQSSGKFSPITNMLRSSSSATETRPEKVKKAKKRVELDDFDSSPEAQEPADPLEDPIESHELEPESMVPNERLSESPVQVSPVDAHISNPPALMVDSSSQEDPSVSTSSPPSSPELIDAQEAHDTKLSEVTPDSTTLSSTTAPVWSDASLRTYLEDNSDVKDLLVVVHDKSEAVSPGPDHPFTAALFKNENRRLVEISNQLDGILGDWLARKSRIAAQ